MSSGSATDIEKTARRHTLLNSTRSSTVIEDGKEDDVSVVVERANVNEKEDSSSGNENTKEKNNVDIDVERAAEDASVPTLTFPDGGLRAWLAIAGGFLVQYVCFGYINSFGVYQDYYARIYLTAYAPSDIGWIGGVQVFLNFSMGAVTGKIFDRGYFHYLMTACLVLHSLGLFMLSLSHQNSYYQVFLTQGVTMGLASGLSYVPSLGIAGHYFHHRRSLAVGIISSGAALGAVLHPIMLNKFFSGPIGFHNGIRISAALNTTLLLIATVIMRTRLPPKKLQKFPIGQWLREPAYFMALIAGCFVFFGLFYPVFSLQLDAVKHGVNKQFAFYATSVLNAASFFGRSIPGAFAPQFGVFNLAIFSTVAGGIVVYCMAAVHDETGAVLFAVFFGFFSGAAIALTPAMLAHLCKDPSEYGTRTGVFFGIGGVIGLFATPISGALLTTEYIWIRPIIFAGTMMTASGITYLGVRQVFVNRLHTQRV